MSIPKRYLFSIAISVCTASNVLHTQSLPEGPQLVGKLAEDYSSEVNASGSLVTGVWLGEIDGKVELKSIVAHIPIDNKMPHVCLIATTRDGLYYSEGALKANINPSGSLQVKALEAVSYTHLTLPTIYSV